MVIFEPNRLPLIRQGLFALIALALTAPWLNPITSGPTPSLVPMVVSFAAAAAFLLSLSLLTVLFPDSTFFQVQSLNWWIAGTWLAAGIVGTAMGLVQYYGGAAFFNGLISPSRLGEAFGNLRQRNQYASMLNIAFAAALCFVSFANVRRRTPHFALAAVAALAIGNAASSSRTGLAQLIVLCLISGIWGRWRDSRVGRMLITALAVYLVAIWVMPGLANLDFAANGMFARLKHGDPACNSRLTLWSNVLHLISLKPWFGWGWGGLSYAHFITPYDGLRFCEILDNAHNLPLHLAVELGMPASVLICSGLVWATWRQRPWAETDPWRQMAWMVLAVIGLHSLLEYPLWYGPFQMATALSVWILWRPSGRPFVSGELVMPGKVGRVVCGALALVMVIGVGVVAVQYHRVSQIYLSPAQRSPEWRDNTLQKLQANLWLFENQLRFAEFSITPLTRDNAEAMQALGKSLLHFSPEPRVVEKLIDALVMLGRDDEATFYLARYRAAYPDDYSKRALTSSAAKS